MKQTAIFAPFFAMIFLTFVVWIYMYARRFLFVRKNNLGLGQLTPAEFARISPPAVSNSSNNLKNLFEIPTIFYGLVLCLYATNQVDTTHVAAAWIFVAFRMLHSIVHCSVNIVALRFWLYFISTASLWFMALRAALRLFG
jgi:hypothetical protein